MEPLQGIHHITAMAGNAQRNLDFYEQVLGQRLVKTTVNFDDPGTYHLYYGDEVGTPGTILTFFPWQGIVRGQQGNGEVAAIGYSIPPASVDFWRARLLEHDIAVDAGETRFGAAVLAFADPDGMPLELIADDRALTLQLWAAGPVPAAHALRGFHSATLWLSQAEPTGRYLTDLLGFTEVNRAGHRIRYQGAGADIGLYVDLVERPGQPRGRMGAGSVHHLAFRTVDDAEQLEYQRALHQAGVGVTPVRDRQYFHSIYFREPGGVLFEIATDAPGFAYDEPVAELGQHLKLPSWLETQRTQIERLLPSLERRAPQTITEKNNA
jgi:glyoxalase family protein